MKSCRIFFAILCVLALSFNVFAEPPNLGLIKKAIEIYHDSGAYEKEFDHVIRQAHQYLVKQVEENNQQHKKKQLALVLDIDETSLSNYDKLARRHFVGDQAEIHQEILAANSIPIKPTLSLYNEALSRGVKVFFVTGRNQSECTATKKNLLNAGYKNWAGLYCKPNNYNFPSIAHFKTKTRALLTKQGYTVVATIGDQYSDLLGGFAQKTFKLPNPFYYLP